MLYRVEIVGQANGVIHFEDYIDDNSDNVDFAEKFVEFCKDFHNKVQVDTHHSVTEKEHCRIEVTRFTEVSGSENR